MPFQLTLYRAPEGVGPIHTWDREYRQPLGTKQQVRASLDRALPGLRWEDHGTWWFAAGPFAGEDHAVEISLHGGSSDVLLDVLIYALPPPVRAVMSALDLNYCFAMESCQLYWPFEAGNRWPAVGQPAGTR